MKKRVKEEPLLNTLARKVGHAAGTIAKATQGLTADAVAIVGVQKNATPPKPAKKVKRRAAKKKKKAASSAARPSRKRSSRA
jgi:hypothetical protein